MVGAICVNKMSSKRWRFNRANHLPHLARLVISSHLRRRDELISGPRAARAFASQPALSAPREEPKEHLFAARGAEATRISLRWAADVLEELEHIGDADLGAFQAGLNFVGGEIKRQGIIC